ncbi:hypothetical protein ISS04_02215 [Candidatus Woesearchaeota archaeon]|nr:hypothetical protein [Candidatus Woesearchaeota archaeon]
MLSRDRELKNELREGVLNGVKTSRKKSSVNQIEPVKVEEFKQIITPIEEIIK